MSAIAALVGLGLVGAAPALAQPAPAAPQRVTGVVSALTSNEIVLQPASGAPQHIALLPDWKVIVSTPVTLQQIQPGSYIGTTNYAKPDGTGRSVEVHVSPPGVAGPGVDFVMDAQAGTTMTNGVISKVVEASGARVATVDYGKGVRTVTIPDNIPIVLNSPAERSAVKVGERVRVATFQRDGSPPVQYVTVGPGVSE